MTSKVSWYFEEFYGGKGVVTQRWYSAYALHGLTRDQAVSKMEERKRVFPRARLRLVCINQTTRTYRERKA